MKLIPFLAALVMASPSYAEPATPQAAEIGSTSEGVVRKVDPSSGKITLKHGPIANLGMPPMTMVFHVQSPELIGKVKAGDKVKFRAENINGAFTLTSIEVMP